MLDDEEIQRLVVVGNNNEDKHKIKHITINLINRANDNGGQDNITLIIVKNENSNLEVEGDKTKYNVFNVEKNNSKTVSNNSKKQENDLNKGKDDIMDAGFDKVDKDHVKPQLQEVDNDNKKGISFKININKKHSNVNTHKKEGNV